MDDCRIFWGEAHDNTYQFEVLPAPVEDIIGAAASHLDFYAAAYYTSFSPGFVTGGHPSSNAQKHPIVVERWKEQERLDREWAELQEATKQMNRPGSFVTFPGYEWQGNGRSGDHNVFALTEGLPIFRVDTLAELYACLRGREAIAIPHHTAYRPGQRGRDWSVYDEGLSPFSEVFSIHGCSETDEEWIGLRANTHMGPGIGGGAWQDALDRGYHIGAICSTDNWGAMPGHHGRGRMACLARELTRESLWEAFRARRVYGVSGDRIHLDFRVNDAVMGSVINSDGKRSIRVKVVGSDALDRIELLRNGRVIATHCHQGTWGWPTAGPVRFKVRIEAGWGPSPAEAPVLECNWRGELAIDKGRVIGFEPCWISPGQGQPRIEGGRAAFDMHSTTRDVRVVPQNANVFECEADVAGEMAVRMNGLEERGGVAAFAAGSRVMWFKDECVRMLHERLGIEPGSPERNDVYYHAAFKTKIHRPIPEAGYTAQFEHEDDEPLDGEVNYRIRVEQRNGERAWSSPIWVTPRS